MALSTASSGSITSSLIIVILAVCFGTNFQFYTNSVTSNLVEICENWMNQSYSAHYGAYIHKHITMSALWSFTSASLQIGCFVGALFTRFLADKFGRRKALIISSTMSMTGSILNLCCKLANSFEMFIIGRFLIGTALGSGLALASIFIVEIAPVRYRGACGSAQQVLAGLGNVLSYSLTVPALLGTDSLWQLAVGIPPLIAGASQFFVLLIFAYDSPRHLILSTNDKEKGFASLKFYEGKAGAEIRFNAIEDEKRTLQSGIKAQFHFLDLFRNGDIRRPLLIALTIIFGTQMSGISAVLAYSKTMFVNAGLDDETAQYASIGLGFCNFLSPLLSMFVIEKSGRKVILLLGLCACDAMLISLSICVYGSGMAWAGANIATIPSLYVFQLGFGLANSIVLIAPAELFPQKARASAMTVVFCFSWSLQIICVLGYLPFSNLVGVEYSYIPFIIAVSVAIVLLIVYMPETKGKTVEEVASLFTKRKKTISDSSSDSGYAIKF